MTQRSNTQHAFSLVELSIVLVILGLLVGGVLSGQSLIRAAELRSVSTEYARYITATQSFRDKYFSIPGDMNNATAFGAAWVGNGDGDGSIEMSTTATSNEISLFWIHLANAGLIEGSYTNIAATNVSNCGTMTGGVNNPKSKLNNAAWNVVNMGTVAITSAVDFPATYNNVLIFAAGTNCYTTTGAPSAVLKPEEAWNIDTKLDDGKPDLGSIMTYEINGNTALTNCSDQDGAATALPASNYVLTNTAVRCSFIMKTNL